MPTAAAGLMGGLGQDALGGQGQDQQRQPMGMYSRTSTTTTQPGQMENQLGGIRSQAMPPTTTPQSPLTMQSLEQMLGGTRGLMQRPEEDPTKQFENRTGGMRVGT